MLQRTGMPGEYTYLCIIPLAHRQTKVSSCVLYRSVSNFEQGQRQRMYWRATSQVSWLSNCRADIFNHKSPECWFAMMQWVSGCASITFVRCWSLPLPGQFCKNLLMSLDSCFLPFQSRFHLLDFDSLAADSQLLQFGILLTGNYGFFNLLSVSIPTFEIITPLQ